jgi:glutamate synthase domain-containing protein 1
MCGIVGIYLKNKKLNKDLGKLLTGMMNNMATRGPDSAGFAIYSPEKKISTNIQYALVVLVLKKLKVKLLKKLKMQKLKLLLTI